VGISVQRDKFMDEMLRQYVQSGKVLKYEIKLRSNFNPAISLKSSVYQARNVVSNLVTPKEKKHRCPRMNEFNGVFNRIARTMCSSQPC